MLDLDGLLRFAVEQGASDVHVKVGSRPRLRVDGRLREGPFDTVEPADTERVAAGIIPRGRAESFQATNECDFMYGIAGLGRFRVSAFRQRSWVGLVLRRVLPGIPSFEALGLPAAVPKLAEEQHGLVLVTGLAGAGKTATLAAMVDHVNTHREGHIVTVEDPVEVLHPDKRSIVDQREVGADTPSAVSGLEHALRQDPDVLMVGELRDADAAWAVLQAAEIGHLVLAGMSTVSAIDTIDRFIELFPPHRQRQARASLAGSLRGSVSQRLLPRAGGRGRVPAVEILVVNTRVRERIADPERLGELENEMVHGDLYGMQTFDQSLVHLYRNGLVARDDAIAHANAASEMRFSLDRADLERTQETPPPPPPPTAPHVPGPPIHVERSASV
ncbi:MAG: twitching motility protein PilT [Actinomycetota bacterium]|nr:twitching motility protein PilT [Actinomycetota bacterium]